MKASGATHLHTKPTAIMTLVFIFASAVVFGWQESVEKLLK